MTLQGSRSRLAALAALGALALAACSPRAGDVTAPTPDGGLPDAAAGADGGGADGGGADGGDARCVPGGTTGLEPITVACAQPTPARLVLDDANVYWTVQSGGPVVMKAPLAGGAVVPLVYDSAAAVGLAVDPLFVYYTQPSLGRVMRVSIAGGAPVALATKLDAPLFLALADGALYWTGGQGNAGFVIKLELEDGAKPVTLIDGQRRPRAIAVQDGFVYWTDFADGSILRTPAVPTTAAERTDAGLRTATRLASGLRGPSDLVLEGGFAYAPDQAGRVVRVPLEGGALETVAEVDGVPFGVATDGVSLYWSTLGRGGIFRTSLRGGGRVDAIAGAEPDPHFVAVGDIAVFWGTWGAGGAVKKAAK